jgi:hypothetical protein
VSNVFIIINEWIGDSGNVGAEVVGPSYFTSEDDAWSALRDIAVTYEVELPPDELGFSLEGHRAHIQFEEYYVQELTQK